MQIIQFILALPEMLKAFQAAMNMWKKMQEEKFYSDSVKVWAKYDQAKSDEEIKAALVELRDLYRS